MFWFTKYGPYICIGVVLAILFVIWAFCGGREYEFVGLGPLDPETCGTYVGSMYSWGNITPADNNLELEPEGICVQNVTEIDNTPVIADNFLEESICLQQEPTEIISIIPEVPNPPKKKGRFVSRGERICCETMEKIYGVPFTTVRPSWLTNPETGRALELDCYNDDLKIGVEYNGEQHYKWPNYTNQSNQQFIDQVRRDQLKTKLCERNGVYLIVVPYKVPHKNIPSFIMSHLPETIQRRIQEERILS